VEETTDLFSDKVLRSTENCRRDYDVISMPLDGGHLIRLVLIDTLGSEGGLGHGLVFANDQPLSMAPCFEVVQWADDSEDGDGRATRLADAVDFVLEAAIKWQIRKLLIAFRANMHSLPPALRFPGSLSLLALPTKACYECVRIEFPLRGIRK
jgi:hypothetical protein